MAAAADAQSPDVCNLEMSRTKSSIDEGKIEEANVANAGLLDVFSKPQLVLIWCGLLLMSTINYLNVSTLFTFSVYALSDFSRASAEGTLNTVLGVVGIGKRPVPCADFVLLRVITVYSYSGAIGIGHEAVPVSFPPFLLVYFHKTFALTPPISLVNSTSVL